MNICFVLKNFSDGGIGRAVSLIANKLHQNNYNVFGLCYTFEGKESIFSVEFKIEEVYKKSLPIKDALVKEHFIKKTKEFVEKNEIDVIIACGVMYYPVCVIVSKICRIKCICWEHTNPLISCDVFAQKQIRWFGAKFSNVNVVLTKKALEIYKDKYRKYNNVQIYNPIDPYLLSIKPQYNYNSKKIISVGRLSYPKNFQRLIKIASQFIENYKDWSWDIYGSGADEDELKGLISEYKLDNQVRLMGEHDDIYSVFSDYSFMVMTSRYEGFPMTLLEGAANGMPLIAFDILTGPNEIIKNGYNGKLCNPCSDNEMVEAIEEMINNKELRIMMSKNSINKVKDYNIDLIYKKWNSLLHKL